MHNYLFTAPIECVIRAKDELQALQILDDNNVDYSKCLDYGVIEDSNVYFWMDEESQKTIPYFMYTANLMDELEEPLVLIVGGVRIW